MKVTEILKQVQDNQISIEQAQELLENPLDYATIDFNRQKRTGVPEVIYGESKTKEQIAGIINNMLDHDVSNILVTRVSQEKYQYLKQSFPSFEYDQDARTFLLNQKPNPINKGKIVVVCAGTSDLPVAKEAYIVASYLGNEVELVCDVGVAGLHRLFNKLEIIQEASVLIVVAGMEGALASVVGGLVHAPIIAVPTSVGYGANFQGLSALLSMLNSCASGVAVVNIDNGFGAGYMAHSINNLGGKR
ncbi:nickel pincer cofactor biosynthesis protein LarB [uncultured Thomasclavelia sp.]|uniref:nickel pincer cofactor biosynthesis protein LarB n=1 Tax=uncultured Thomasclavelia sp. TaxID=3025759 RepID=UPI0025E9A2F7|nr:nickel pincer cofactor biosynthesis protein LarB [uncultured Thomasclavelia sp.]